MSVIELILREISYVLHVHALMTRKSCVVGMRNAILRNYLKLIIIVRVFAYLITIKKHFHDFSLVLVSIGKTYQTLKAVPNTFPNTSQFITNTSLNDVF